MRVEISVDGYDNEDVDDIGDVEDVCGFAEDRLCNAL